MFLIKISFKPVYVFSAFLVLVISLFFVTRGIEYYDEGYILHAAQRLNYGEVIYRDFHFAYMPGSAFVTYFAFKIIGESVLSERLIALLINLVTLLLMFSVVKTITSNKIYILFALCVNLFWGIGHINFVWPVMLAISSGILNCFILLKFISNRKSIYFFMAGISVVLTFLFKQNFGIALFLSNFLSLILINDLRKKNVIYYLFGIIASLALFILYLTMHGSLFFFIDDFKVYTIDRIILEGTLNTSFIYGNYLLEKIIRLLFYLLPLFLSLFSIFLSIRKEKKYLIIGLFSCFYYLFGIRPTTDYNHLVPILSISGLSFAVILSLVKVRVIKLVNLSLLILIALIGIYTSFFKGYYRWEAPLIENNFYSNNQKLLIWTDERRRNGVLSLMSYIKKEASREDYIYVNYYAPFIYFLSDRKNATKYSIHPSNRAIASYYEEVVNDLRNKHVELVVTHVVNKSENSMIGEFIRSNYKPSAIIDDYVIWKRI